MISRNGTSLTYSYDYENRLTKVVHSGTTAQTNSHKGDGNRVKQVAGSSTFAYSYQGLNILYEKNVISGVTSGLLNNSVLQRAPFFESVLPCRPVRCLRPR